MIHSRDDDSLGDLKNIKEKTFICFKIQGRLSYATRPSTCLILSPRHEVYSSIVVVYNIIVDMLLYKTSMYRKTDSKLPLVDPVRFNPTLPVGINLACWPYPIPHTPHTTSETNE